MAQVEAKENELILSEGEFAYTQDIGKGSVSIHTGPNAVTITAQQHPVVFLPLTREFKRCSVYDAKQQNLLVAQGHYAILWNPPVAEGDFPPSAAQKTAPSLSMGKRVTLHGPLSFGLWPLQSAKVIKGHYLRSDQYVLCRVYDEEQARANFDSMVMKTVEGEEATDVATITGVRKEDLSHGRQFIVRGTEVSFFMPPTGIRVVPEDHEGEHVSTDNSVIGTRGYVREALTLERLQYCILIDQNGDKEYPKGPNVVFPRPTQDFFEKDGSRIFRATELNNGQGIYVKVIAAYTEEDGTPRSVGEELFITGKDTTIYFPRQEHSLIRYEGRSKHFATAIPSGEGRYVMNRDNAVIDMVEGPNMLLPDPRTDVIVRRVLTDDECNLWYPGNPEAVQYNQTIRALEQRTPTTRAAPTAVEVERRLKGHKRAGAMARYALSDVSTSNALNMELADSSSVHSADSGAVADEFVRGSTYTEPRTIVLNTKYSGVPRIQPYTGYAVMVVNTKGQRRVVEGPNTILMEYDETLEKLALSSGKPKSTDHLMRTPYLRIYENQIGEVFDVETADHVEATAKISLRGDFFGETPEEKAKWFGVSNYVKLVCDHVKSLVKGAVRHMSVKDFYADPTSIIRDTILGTAAEGSSRPGLIFEEIGFRVKEVEVIKVLIGDREISNLLATQQHNVVQSEIQLARAQKELEVETELQSLARKKAMLHDETSAFTANLKRQSIERNLETSKVQIAAAMEEDTAGRERQQLVDAALAEKLTEQLVRDEKQQVFNQAVARAAYELRTAESAAQTQAAVDRFQAASGPFAEAIQLLGNQDVVTKVAEALSAQKLLGGKNATDVIGKLFEGTGMESFFTSALSKAAPIKSGNGRTPRPPRVEG